MFFILYPAGLLFLIPLLLCIFNAICFVSLSLNEMKTVKIGKKEKFHCWFWNCLTHSKWKIIPVMSCHCCSDCIVWYCCGKGLCTFETWSRNIEYKIAQANRIQTKIWRLWTEGNGLWDWVSFETEFARERKMFIVIHFASEKWTSEHTFPYIAPDDIQIISGLPLQTRQTQLFMLFNGVG